MAKSFTAGQLKGLLVIIEDTVIKVFWNRIQNLESKIANMQEGNKHQKGEVNALQWSTKFQNGTYEKMKKDMTEEKKELETDYGTTRIPEIKKYTEEIIYDLWVSRRSIEQKMKHGRKAKQNWKFFRQVKLGLETKEITIERRIRIWRKKRGKEWSS